MKNTKRIGIVVGLFLLFLGLATAVLYFAEASRLKEQFGRAITVNQQSLRGLTAEKAAEKMNQNFQNHPLILKENGETVCQTTLGEAGYSLDTSALTGTLQELIASQKTGIHLFKKPEDVSVTCTVNLDEEAFTSAFTEKTLSGDRIDAVNAYLNYDETQGKFVIVPEVAGTRIDAAALQTLIKSTLDAEIQEDHLAALPDTLEVSLDDNVYVKPEITADQEEIQSQMAALNDELNRYRNTTITYLFGDTTEVIDGNMICSWLIVDTENNSVQLSEEAIREYISQLATSYNTIYRDRTFTTTGGASIKLEHNEYGYRIDQDAEYEQLCADLGSGESIQREPIYSKAGYKRNGKDDLAGCYIEVSLEQQHLWLYKDGHLVTETDIVSGKPGKETETCKGAWTIAYKASPYTLSSDIYGYSVSVDYWMPFVYGQGLHDMKSRSAFGGDIYKTNGSHGCVNLPPDQAKLIYETIDKGYAVILY